MSVVIYYIHLYYHISAAGFKQQYICLGGHGCLAAINNIWQSQVLQKFSLIQINWGIIIYGFQNGFCSIKNKNEFSQFHRAWGLTRQTNHWSWCTDVLHQRDSSEGDRYEPWVVIRRGGWGKRAVPLISSLTRSYS